MKYIEQFIEWLNLNYEREATRQIYLRNVEHYFKKKDIFDQESIDSYFMELNVANSSHARIVSSFKIYQKFLINHTKEPISIVYPRTRKARTGDPKYITEKELEEILAKLPVVFQDYDKVRAVIAFMFYTGMRPNEIIELKREEINLDQCRIELLKTKTHHDRDMTFPVEIKALIENYFSRCSEIDNAFNINKRYLDYICKKIKKCFGLKYFSPYVLRHSFAKFFMKISNNNMTALQKLMGHSDIAITLGYLKSSNEEAIEIYNSIVNKKKRKKK